MAKRCTSRCVGCFPCSACRDVPDPEPPTSERDGMAQLIEPDGTNGLITTVADAVAYCAAHPGWTWQHTDDGGSD